jgi:hypothetical protein
MSQEDEHVAFCTSRHLDTPTTSISTSSIRIPESFNIHRYYRASQQSEESKKGGTLESDHSLTIPRNPNRHSKTMSLA